MSDTPLSPPLERPASPLQMFLAFNRLALQGFGGVLPVAQRELVERRGWLSRAQFLEMLAVAQVLPGPNIINLALAFGDRCFGWRGIVAAVGGLLLVPLFIVLVAAVLYGEFSRWPMVAGALRGMGAVAAGLVISTAIKLFGGLREHPLGRPWCLAYAGAAGLFVGAWRWPLAGVVLGVGGLAVLHVGTVLRQRERAGSR